MRIAPVESLEDRVLLSTPDQWLQRGLSGGGVLMAPALSPHNPAELFVATDMSQMFHSKDSGQSWDMYNFNEFVVSNKVSGVQFTSDPMVLFGLDQENFAFPAPIRSTDAGTTWHKVGTSGFGLNWPATEQAWRLFTDPTSPGRLIVATQDEIYLSADAGASFQSVYTYTGTVSTSLKQGLHVGGAFFDGANIFVGSNAGLLVSTGGASFQSAAIGGIPAGEAIYSFAGASDGTTTRLWAVTHTASTISTPMNPDIVYSAFQNMYSLDWGQPNWTVKATGLAATTDLSNVATAANDIDTAYVGGQDTVGGILSLYVGRYTTAAGTWTRVFNTKAANSNVVTGFVGPGGHIQFSPTIEGLVTDPMDSSRLMVTDGWVAHTSSDGGQLWQQVYVPLSQDHAPGVTVSKTEAYNNTGINNTSVWWIHWSSPTNMFAAYDDLKWQRSTDGGGTWSFDVNGLDQKRENFHLETHPTSGRIYLSQGRSWAAHDFLGLSDSAVNQGGGDIAYSDDGGANWKILFDFGNPVDWTAIDPNDPKTMYASVIDPDPTIGGLYVSHNIDLADSNPAAVNFTRLAAQPPGNVGKPHTIEVLGDGTLVLVHTARKYDHDNNPATADVHSSGSGVYRLDPGTSQWTDVTGTNMHYWCKDLIVDPNDSSQNTWYVAVATAIQPVQLTPGYPSNKPGLYMTTNRGQTWTRVFDKDADSITVNPSNPSEAYLASNSDGLWYTSNVRLADGVTINPNPTFTPLLSFPHQRPNRVFFNPYVPGEVWVASNGAGMLVGNASQPLRTFDFSAANYAATESDGSATITVTRSGDTASSMSVDYIVSAGSAAAGLDFAASNLPTGISGTLTFLPGQTTVLFTVAILDDLLIEGPETVQLALAGPIGGNVLGATSTAVLTISDDEPLPPDPAPTVTDIRVHFGSQTVSILGITRTLPWVNIAAIDVIFSEGVYVDIGDLKLTGINVSHYSFSGFSYDSAKFTARWNLTAALAVDRLLMTLDGDDSSSDGNAGVSDSPASGNPSFLAGGDYSLNFNVLPGDVTGDDCVKKTDIKQLRKQIGVWSLYADLDGDGDVDAQDVAVATQRLHSRLP